MEKTAMTTLERKIALGEIFIDHGEYVGHAADGIEVCIGCIGDEGAINKFLAEYPTPAYW